MSATNKTIVKLRYVKIDSISATTETIDKLI